MIVALAGELSSLSLIAYPANVAIPVTRFVGFAWLILVGGLLPKTLGPMEGGLRDQVALVTEVHGA
jgi:hypothetical protein